MATIARVAAAASMLLLAACAAEPAAIPLSPPSATNSVTSSYRIGPGDQLEVFVWRQPALSVTVPVRPDGKISIPLVQSVPAIGKTPGELARTIKTDLKRYITNPQVTVIVRSFGGPLSRQIRVIGAAVKPEAVPYQTHMTLLDVMIDVGGLTKFAAGNRAVIVRDIDGKEHSYHVYLSSLINDGEIKYNVPMQPGDILIIPETYF